MSDPTLDELFAALSLKDLRALISEAGLSDNGCIDKSDLRTRGREALDRLKAPGAKLGPVSKPLVAQAVAEELDIFTPEEEKAKKAQEAETMEREAAARRQAEAEAARAEEQAAKEREAAEEAAKAAKAEAEAKAMRDEAEAKAKRAAAKAAKAAAAAEAKEAAALLEAVAAADADRVRELLKESRPSSKGEDGNTALHTAASKGLVEIAELLLAAGGSPNATNEHGHTPLHRAAMYNRIEVATLLLERGAEPSTLDANGQTAREYAELNNRAELAVMLGEAEAQRAAREAEAAAREREAAAAAEAEAEATREAAALVGKQVAISGLKARPDANGKVGYVLSATGNGRCTVAVKVGDEVEQLALRPANLAVQS